MDSVATLQRVIDETTRLVDHVSPEQLDNKTLCTEWTVRDVINHVTGGSIMVRESLEQGSVSGERLGQLMSSDNLGDDYKGSFRAAAGAAMDAVRAPGAMDKMVTLPFGQMPGAAAVGIGIFDVTTHACDLAQATGQSVADQELLEVALAAGRQMIGPEMRQPGVFDPEQSVAADAPAMLRLLAFAGRHV
jgi:uncharacterized protein (TIGR03086 family)